MAGSDDRFDELRTLGRAVAVTNHDALSEETIDEMTTLSEEVAAHLDGAETATGANKLLAFWEAYVDASREDATAKEGSPTESPVERFERAFDADLLGVDLYEALETLAIVSDLPDEEMEEDRLELWANRVHSLTADFAEHLETHRG